MQLFCVDHVLEALQRQSTSTASAAEEEKEKRLEEEDEALACWINFKKSIIRRISVEDVDDDDRDFQFTSSQSSLKKRELSEQVPRKPKLLQILVLRKPVEKCSGLKSLCQNYYSDDDEWLLLLLLFSIPEM